MEANSIANVAVTPEVAAELAHRVQQIAVETLGQTATPVVAATSAQDTSVDV